jgi:acetyltransferase
VEVVGDRAVALPPLNLALARDLVAHTRVARLLGGYRDRAAIDHEALYLALLKVSQLVCDCPEVAELDINPLLADDRGVIALDARVRVQPARGDAASRLAIRPYPAELEERLAVGGRSIFVRPVRPEDEPRLKTFYADAAPEELRLRFFMTRRELAHSELARFSQLDYDREMAFIAFDDDTPDGRQAMLGEVRVSTDPDNQCAEFAIMLRAQLQRQGLGRALMAKMIRYLRGSGTTVLAGECRNQNRGMVGLASAMGFTVQPNEDGETTSMTLDLRAPR